VTTAPANGTNKASGCQDNGDNNGNTTVPKAMFGQQCSPTCGCVVRFEAHFSDGNAAKLDHVSYHAKRVVTSRRNPHGGPLTVQLTTKGKAVMLEPCTCKTLHQLSKATVSHMMQQWQKTYAGDNPTQNVSTTLSQLAQLEFKHVRSSPAFCRSVLAAQGLPSNDTHCVDVLEEALTALCKGYLPLPRRQPVMSSAVTAQHEAVQGSLATTQQQRRRRHQGRLFRSGGKAQLQRYLDESNINKNDDDDQYNSFLKFGHSWREHADEEHFLQAMVDKDQGASASSSTWWSTLLDVFQLLPVSSTQSSAAKENHNDPSTNVDMKGKKIEDAIQQHHRDWISFVDKEHLRLEDDDKKQQVT